LQIRAAIASAITTKLSFVIGAIALSSHDEAQFRDRAIDVSALSFGHAGSRAAEL
jgi:hypothetical protein